MYKEAYSRDIFLYLSAYNILMFNNCLTDKYKNMSLLREIAEGHITLCLCVSVFKTCVLFVPPNV